MFFPLGFPLCGNEEILLPVEYFIYRYARKAGKKMRTIEKNTLGLLQAYARPGNIRELQNVIERSFICADRSNGRRKM
jgi:formate hydrogenlyase transcriptional activator